MAKWTWNSGALTADFNPEKDSYWQYKAVNSRRHVPGANFDIIQSAGIASCERTIEGVTQSTAYRDGLVALVDTVVVITDHRSVSFTAYVESIDWEEVMDITNLPTGTWRYRIVLVKQ